MIRDIRKLDGDTRQQYGLILANLMKNIKDTDVFQMKAFYKVMAYIRIPKNNRKKIIDYFIKNEAKSIDLQKSIDALLSKVKGQERDILRFSLMQDIVSVMMANHYLSEEKKELLEKIQNQLHITDEQMRIFEEELDTEGKLSLNENDVDKKTLVKRKISKYISVGIPLTLLYYSAHNAYRHNFKSFALLQVDKKINPRKSIFSLGKYLVLGGVLYKGLNWGANHKRRSQDKLGKMLAEESRQLINLGRKYLEEDLNYCEKMHGRNILSDNQIRFKLLMEKALMLIND